VSTSGENPTPPRELVPLAHLAPGVQAVIEEVNTDNGIGRRLLDLGFVPATPVRVLRRAPLGDPVSYELRGTHMCLRRSEAVHILVRRRGSNGTTAA
jgi:Fe2+ transport system protein FeoA